MPYDACTAKSYYLHHPSLGFGKLPGGVCTNLHFTILTYLQFLMNIYTLTLSTMP